MQHLFDNNYQPQLNALCQKYKVKKLYAFGSVLTEHFNTKESDIDLIVELEHRSPLQRGEALIAIWDGLEALFDCKIDLLTQQPIQNQFFKQQVEQTKMLIYEQTKQ